MHGRQKRLITDLLSIADCCVVRKIDILMGSGTIQAPKIVAIGVPAVKCKSADQW